MAEPSRSSSSRPPSRRPDGARGASGGSGGGSRPGGSKRPAGRGSSGKPASGRTSGTGPARGRPSDAKPGSGRSTGGKPGSGRSAGGKPGGSRADGARSGAGRTGTAPGRGGRPGDGRGRPTDGRGRPRRDEERPVEAGGHRPEEGPRQWGSLARKGARRLDEDVRGAGTAAPSERERDVWEPEEWIDEGPMRAAAEDAVERGGRRGGGRAGAASGPEQPDVDVGAAELGRAVGPARAAKVERKLREAAEAFEHERYGEARSILAPLVDQAPSSAALRELHGLTLYRLGRWKKAAEELEAFRQMSGSSEQNPVLADCYRALKRYRDVEELWDELREESPGAALVTEGRIVMAGALADQGQLDRAVSLLQQGFSLPKRPKLHHLRRAYALADLQERVGEVPAARSLFERVAAVDPEFADVQARARALS